MKQEYDKNRGRVRLPGKRIFELISELEPDSDLRVALEELAFLRRNTGLLKMGLSSFLDTGEGRSDLVGDVRRVKKLLAEMNTLY